MHLTVTGVDYRPHGIAAVTVSSSETVGGDAALAALDADGRKIDAAPALILSDTALLHRLIRGRTLTPAEWEAIRDEGRHGLAVRYAMGFVAHKPRSEAEVRRALLAHPVAFDASEVDRALARLRDLGAVDDGRWASSYVAQSRASGRGAGVLRRELSRRGVESEHISSALDGRDEPAEALAAALKRTRSLRGVDREAARRRLYDFLRRRGFQDSTARAAMEIALAELFTEASVET